MRNKPCIHKCGSMQGVYVVWMGYSTLQILKIKIEWKEFHQIIADKRKLVHAPRYLVRVFL